MTHFDVETVLNKRMKMSRLLFGISIGIAVIVGYFGFKVDAVYYLWAMYFVIMGALALPTINKCKSDMQDAKKLNLDSTLGKILDAFPEKEQEPNGNWIFFIDVEGKSEVEEFAVPVNPSLKENEIIRINHTKILKVPVSVEKIVKPTIQPSV